MDDLICQALVEGRERAELEMPSHEAAEALQRRYKEAGYAIALDFIDPDRAYAPPGHWKLVVYLNDI